MGNNMYNIPPLKGGGGGGGKNWNISKREGGLPRPHT